MDRQHRCNIINYHAHLTIDLIECIRVQFHLNVRWLITIFAKELLDSKLLSFDRAPRSPVLEYLVQVGENL